MEESEKKVIDKIIQIARKDEEVIAVALFGSFLKNEKGARDIDICLFLGKKYPNLEMSKKRLFYLSAINNNRFDIQIFQQLPLYIRARILKEGKILFCKDESLIYEIASATIKEFEFYKKIYYNYIESIGK